MLLLTLCGTFRKLVSKLWLMHYDGRNILSLQTIYKYVYCGKYNRNYPRYQTCTWLMCIIKGHGYLLAMKILIS